MPLELARIRGRQLLALSRERTLFLIPVGGLEDHGPHLPMGTDLIQARAMAFSLAERLERELHDWTCVVLPVAPLAIDADSASGWFSPARALTVRGHVLRDWCVDACLGLARLGFSRFACVSAQLGPRQLTAIEEAGKLVAWLGLWGWVGRAIRSPLTGWPGPAVAAPSAPAWTVPKPSSAPPNRRPRLASFSSALVRPGECFQAPFWRDSPEHGGERETSILLAVAPDSVERISSPSGAVAFGQLPGVPLPPSRGARFLAWLAGNRPAYWGNPAVASSDAGRAAIEADLDRIFAKIRAWLLEDANPEGLFRSWYSVFPPNRSFFKAWALFLALVSIVGVWVYWNLAGS